jgi:hypothetical protein
MPTRHGITKANFNTQAKVVLIAEEQFDTMAA